MATIAPPTTGQQLKQPLKKQSRLQFFTLKLHLYLGLTSAIFLLILGFTGAIIGFEQEIPRWLHPSLFYVKPATQTLSEAQLIHNVEQKFAPAHVRSIIFSRTPDFAQVMSIPATNGDPRASTRVFVDPYTGAILGSITGQTSDEKVLQAFHSFHLRIGLGDTGKLIVSIAGAILVFEVVFGLILWWRLKRATIRLSGSWFRVFFDAHNAIGIYASLLLLLVAITGVVIGFDFFEPLIFTMTHSEPLVQRRLPNSTPVAGGNPIAADQAIDAARKAMPEGTVAGMQLPAGPKGAYMVQMRTEETAPSVHSFVVVDQYSGNVLGMQKFKSSLGYRVIRFNRSLHTGDLLGIWGHIIMSLTSVVLIVMVLTGVVIWWKKLAI
jgi:uncharacterized iron-regulated membrane protein